MLANGDGGRCGSPPTAACAVMRGPLCSCPHLTPSHPICCPKSQMGIKRSAKPSTGRWLQKKLRLTLKTNVSNNLHTHQEIFVCLLRLLLFLFIQPLVWCQGLAPCPIPVGQGTPPEGSSRGSQALR